MLFSSYMASKQMRQCVQPYSILPSINVKSIYTLITNVRVTLL